MTRERPDYLSYLLRLRRAREKAKDVWRASLQSPRTGDLIRLRTLEELFAYLRRQTGTAQDAKENGE